MISTPPSGPDRLDDQRLAGVLDGAVTAADTHRADGLARASAATAAHAESLQLESVRVTAKYGADSPRAAAVQTRLAVQSARAVTAQADSERASVGVPQVPPDVAIVFGRVVTAGNAGVAQMTIAALDARGTSLGYTCSVANGAFSLTIPFGAAPQPGTTDATARTLPIVLQVTDQAQATRFRDAQPMTVTQGKAVYRELLLGDPVAACAPPPDPTKTSRDPVKTPPDTTKTTPEAKTTAEVVKTVPEVAKTEPEVAKKDVERAKPPVAKSRAETSKKGGKGDDRDRDPDGEKKP